jgi:hypothetical protein
VPSGCSFHVLDRRIAAFASEFLSRFFDLFGDLSLNLGGIDALPGDTCNQGHQVDAFNYCKKVAISRNSRLTPFLSSFLSSTVLVAFPFAAPAKIFAFKFSRPASILPPCRSKISGNRAKYGECTGNHGYPEILHGVTVSADSWARANATHLGCFGWSLAVLGLGGWGDHDRRVGRAAVLVTPSMMGSLNRKVAHLPFDHAGIAAVSSLDVDLASHLDEQTQVVIFMIGEGGRIRHPYPGPDDSNGVLM